MKRFLVNLSLLVVVFFSTAALVLLIAVEMDPPGTTWTAPAKMVEVQRAIGKRITAAERTPENAIVLGLDDGSSLTFEAAVVRD